MANLITDLRGLRRLTQIIGVAPGVLGHRLMLKPCAVHPCFPAVFPAITPIKIREIREILLNPRSLLFIFLLSIIIANL